MSDDPITHPTTGDELPERPDYDSETAAAIDDALVDLVEAARGHGSPFHETLAANELGSFRLMPERYGSETDSGGDTEELATDGGQPQQHADAYYRWEYDHGTQYLGRMGNTAFALFDFDDNGTIFPLAMNREEFKRRRDEFKQIEADELPEKARSEIEGKFERRKNLSKLLPGGGAT